MLLTMLMWCICLDIRGRCSQIDTPSALVEMLLNWPAVGVPDFKSHRSIVLGPPPIHKRIADLCLLRRSATFAKIEFAKLEIGAATAAVPATWLRKCLRFMVCPFKLESDSSFI